MKETPLCSGMNRCVEGVRGWEGAAKCAFRLGWVSVDSKKYEMMLGVLFPCFPACWHMLSFISSESSLAVIPWDLTASQGRNPPCTLTVLGISPACLGLALSNVNVAKNPLQCWWGHYSHHSCTQSQGATHLETLCEHSLPNPPCSPFFHNQSGKLGKLEVPACFLISFLRTWRS